MGDRGNIFFVDQQLDDSTLGGIYMYSHWGGSALPMQVMRALDFGRDRWGDSQYFARIVFCTLVEDDVSGETGFGLSTSLWDNGHLVIRMHDRDEMVSFHTPGTETDPADKGVAAWSYAEFCDEVDPSEIVKVFLGE